MWQRYNDCIICDCKSIPNVQGLIIDNRARNILVAFNKVLHIWRYEKPEVVLRNNSVSDSYNNHSDTPAHQGQRTEGIMVMAAGGGGDEKANQPFSNVLMQMDLKTIDKD